MAQFQSTRPRGARPGVCTRLCKVVRFNPRARGGRDLLTGSKQGSNVLVSIHAPAGGATTCSGATITYIGGFNPRARGGRDSGFHPGCQRSTCFNPRARGGRDPLRNFQHHIYLLFQSTRPRGARLRKGMDCLAVLCFNPRARGGRDMEVATYFSGTSTFQSTRPRGARLVCSKSALLQGRFQSTRPRGARLSSSTFPTIYNGFQSTRPRGARLRPILSPSFHLMFQSTRPRGARLST